MKKSTSNSLNQGHLSIIGQAGLVRFQWDRVCLWAHRDGQDLHDVGRQREAGDGHIYVDDLGHSQFHRERLGT